MFVLLWALPNLTTAKSCQDFLPMNLFVTCWRTLHHLAIMVDGHFWRRSAGQNAFFATTALLGALLADKRTKQGVDFTSTVGWFALTFPLLLHESFVFLLLGCLSMM